MFLQHADSLANHIKQQLDKFGNVWYILLMTLHGIREENYEEMRGEFHEVIDRLDVWAADIRQRLNLNSAPLAGSIPKISKKEKIESTERTAKSFSYRVRRLLNKIFPFLSHRDEKQEAYKTSDAPEPETARVFSEKKDLERQMLIVNLFNMLRTMSFRDIIGRRNATGKHHSILKGRQFHLLISILVEVDSDETRRILRERIISYLGHYPDEATKERLLHLKRSMWITPEEIKVQDLLRFEAEFFGS